MIKTPGGEPAEALTALVVEPKSELDLAPPDERLAQLEHSEAELRRRLAQLRILYDLTDAVARAGALESVFAAALDGLEAALAAERASILLMDDDGVMRFKAWRNLSDGYRAAAQGHSPWKPGDADIAPLFISDTRQADLGELRSVIEGEGIRALGFFPLIHQGRLCGKFMVYFGAPHEFTEAESLLGQAVARQIAFAVERRRSEEALHRREENFRALAEHSPDIIARFDSEFRHVYVNPAIVAATGMQPSELIGKTNRELGMAPELCDQWEAAYRAVLADGREQLLEFSFPAPDGERHFYSRVVPEFDVSGRVQTVLGVTRDVTALKRAEKTLREQSAFRTAIEHSMPAGVAAVDLQGRQIYVNPAFCDMVGRSEQELLGATPPYAYWPPEEQERIHEAMARTISGQAPPEGFEMRFSHADGRRIDVQVALAPLNHGQDPVGWLACVSDISARKKAEQAVRESEERLRLATQMGKVGLWDWDITSNQVTWTESLYAIHGVNPEAFEASVEGFASLVHPEDLDRVQAALKRSLEEGAPYELQFRCLRPDGSVMWVFTNALVLHRQGRPVRLLGATLDITELKQAEALVRESEERFRMLADSAPVLIWMSGPAKEGLYFNKVWLQFTGRSLEQELGEGWLSSIHPDDLAVAASTCRQAFERREPFTMQLRMRRADGAWRWLLDTGTPRFNPDGSLAGYVGSCIDITDRIHVESEREKLLVSERVARGEAERANRLKDEFLATVSHELRTPLNAIVGWSHLLMQKQDPEEVAEGLAVIQRNSQALGRLVEDLLDVGRIISGKMRLDIQPLRPSEIIEAAVRSVEPAAAAKQIELQKLLEPDGAGGGVRSALALLKTPIESENQRTEPVLGTHEPVLGTHEHVLGAPEHGLGPLDAGLGGELITGDPARLQQVVWNLLSNAIKFTPCGGRVQVRLQRQEAHLQITVSDSGEGIDPELIPFLFERFRQADSSTTRRHGGLGIGLALVRHLTELHGGSVTASSAGPGQGSTFTVTLPLHAPAQPSPQLETADAPATIGGTSVSRPLAGMTLLAIDDDADTLNLLTRLLGDAGASVITASSVSEGLEQVRQHRPAVILCDIGMPGEDGYSFVRRLRQLPADQGGATTVVALTAFARTQDRQHTADAGFSAHLAKPIAPAALIDTLRQHACR